MVGNQERAFGNRLWPPRSGSKPVGPDVLSSPRTVYAKKCSRSGPGSMLQKSTNLSAMFSGTEVTIKHFERINFCPFGVLVRTLAGSQPAFGTQTS